MDGSEPPFGAENGLWALHINIKISFVIMVNIYTYLVFFA